MRSPQEIVSYINKSAFTKAKYSIQKIITLGFLGGAYISMGALLSIVVGYGFPGIAAENPSIVKILMGLTFPMGLVMIVLAGGELFTGNCAYFIPNLMQGKQKIDTILRNWLLVWASNFVGALVFGYFFVYLTHQSHTPTTLDGFMAIAESKTTNPFYVTFLKGIGANWLVCLAMWLGMASQKVSGKIIGIWLPVATFVTIGYEHSIANMFFIPVAMLEGFELSIIELFTKNLLPATLGNIVGGVVFVGIIYGYLYNSIDQKE